MDLTAGPAVRPYLAHARTIPGLRRLCRAQGSHLYIFTFAMGTEGSPIVRSRFSFFGLPRAARTASKGLTRSCFFFADLSTPLIESPGEVGPFHKSPCQVFVATLAIVVAFDFVVAHAFGIDRAAIAGEVARAFEPADLSHFHRNGHPQNLSNARQCVEHYTKLTIPDLKKTHAKCHPREKSESER